MQKLNNLKKACHHTYFEADLHVWQETGDVFWGINKNFLQKYLCDMFVINPNSRDNKGSWTILKDFYCSVTNA